MSDGGAPRIAPENAVETLRAMLAGVSGLDGAELVVRAQKTLRLVAKERALDASEISDGAGVGVRLLAGGRVAQTYSARLDLDSLRSMVARAEEMLTQVPANPDAALPVMSYDGDPARGELADETFANIPTEEKVNRILNLEAKVLDSDPRILRTRDTEYFEVESREWLWTLGSARALADHRTVGRVSTVAVAGSAPRSGQNANQRSHQSNASGAHEPAAQTGGDTAIESTFYDLDWSLVGRNAVTEALKFVDAAPIASLRGPVIFKNKVVNSLLGLLAHALSGENVARGLSFLRDQHGKLALSKNLTLVDDPHARKRPGAAFWDAEGTPTQRLVLVNEGRLENFAHHHLSARQLGLKSTGNAVRASERSAPTVGFHNLTWDAGKRDFVDLLREMNRGLVIYKLLGLHTANPVTGDFSFGAVGTWVENGEEQRGVTGVAIAGNLRELLNAVVSVGRDQRWGLAVAAPSILCENVFISGAST